MRICVLGAGAIGGFIGARLAASGVQTTALARGATLEALRTHGWRVQDGTELLTAPVHASDSPAELGPQDVVVIAVKAHSLAAAASNAGPLLGPDTIVLTAMNGVPWWFFDGFGGPCAGRRLTSVDPHGSIAAAIPTERVLGAVVHMSCSAPEPGLVRHHRGSGLIIGEPGDRDSARLNDLVAVLKGAGLDATATTEIHKEIWYKLWGNLTVNPVSALTGATADLILDDDLVRGFCHAAMLEAQRIGAVIGCPIDQSPQDRSEITRKLGAFKSSMLQDAEAGRRLELDALVGAVREIGQAVDVPTPYIDALLGLTRLSARVRGL
ncbi:MAG TPA: 2-dehydropantoate 2-reductase [Actinocrinis sp.]|uniref:2-dehydropantoate 2-reductase n=1 Tax=Actinocrinis sp. TaxID=1920516 RepID=UPI002D28FDD1|nr:2-dehydropantoate 2-reductase [Actinocrinis sp.]HZU58613.1 2-dehydropantoate 2-reductase [Actinocrinis sp.]